MRMRLSIVAVGFILLPWVSNSYAWSEQMEQDQSVVSAQNTSKGACDRACLENYLDQYLDAMMANDPNQKLFARNCRFTENGVQLPLGGEGLWYSMSGKGTYKFYIPDVETRQIAFIGTVREGAESSNGTLSAVAIRLRINDEGKISEAEQLVIRPETTLSASGVSNSPAPSTGDAVEKMGAPNKMFTEAIPEDERMSREGLVKIANYYFEGLQRNDGKGYYPFADNCVRFENGMQTTTDCKKQFSDGSLKNIVSRIRDRRFVAVDRERGIAFAFGFFDHVQINWTWQIAELFKIENGLISRVEAVFLRCPYGMNSGWSTYEQGMSEEMQSIR